MRRILLSCASLAVLLLPAAAGARVSAHGKSGPGYLVVRKAAGDGGHPVVTLVVKGFVLGRVSPNKEARIDIYHLPRAGHAPQVVGDSGVPVTWRGRVPGMEYNGSGFRFRAIGALYRVVVRSTGVYLFAGGRGNVTLRGSSFDLSGDGKYSLDGAPFRSLPARETQRKLGRG